MKIRKTLSCILLCSLLISGCSRGAVSTGTTAGSSGGPMISGTSAKTTFDYKLHWTNEKSAEFCDYYEKNYHIALSDYVRYYGGFSDELNTTFTNYINEKYNTNFESVPFSAATYFRTYTYVDGDQHPKYLRTHYDDFCEKYIEGTDVLYGVLTNKVVISYLVQNNIPFGMKVPVDNLKALQVKDMYGVVLTEEFKMGIFERLKYFGENSGIKGSQHNISSDIKYTNEDLFMLLLWYNFSVSSLCADERILPLDFFYDDATYKDASKDAIDAFNKHFDKRFNGKGLRLGEVPTKEQFRSVYNDEPIDLSYIPGAVRT